MRIVLLTTAVSLPLVLGAAEPDDIYANPQNLKVLADDISPDELRDTMKGFVFALGVRCQHCHVGEEGQPLDTFDFEADEKTAKQTARDMLRMVRAINRKYVGKLSDEQREGVDVRCVTCHRGQDRPRLIEDILTTQLDTGGIDAATAKYRELRDRHHGSHTFDFSELTLNEYAMRLAADGRHAQALAMVDMNIRYFPDAYLPYWYRGRVLVAQGERAAAADAWRKALKLNPDAKFIEANIRALEDRASPADQL